MPNNIPLPPLERLNELFEIVPVAESQYGTQSGLLWRGNRRKARAGSVAGTISKDKKGRVDWRVRVDYKPYCVSRIIFYMVNSVDPANFEVDHEDRNPLNNNARNLRLGDASLQGHNRGMLANNTSGAVGVRQPKDRKNWMAMLVHKRKKYYLGYHTCKIEAALMYNNKVLELKLDKIGKPLNNLDALECNCSSCQNRPT